MKNWLLRLLGVTIILVGLAGLVWLLMEAVEILREVDNVVLAAFIAVGGAVVTAVTALIVKRVERKHEVEAQFRQRKVDLFEGFLIRFDELSRGNREEREGSDEDSGLDEDSAQEDLTE